MPKLTVESIQSLPTEGPRAVEALAKLCEKLGYKGNQLLLPNGAAVTSITDFMEDNPGAVEALLTWIADNAEACWPDAVSEDGEGGRKLFVLQCPDEESLAAAIAADPDEEASEAFKELVAALPGDADISSWESDGLQIEIDAEHEEALADLLRDCRNGKHGPAVAAMISPYGEEDVEDLEDEDD